jgi:single-strand DNA-binding protein
MAYSLNRTELIGNVGKDPERKVTAGGIESAKFSVAVTEKWKDSQGQKKTKTSWFHAVVYGPQAKVVMDYVKAGDQIYVEGKLDIRDYTDKQGLKKTYIEINTKEFILLGRSGEKRPAPDKEETTTINGGSDYDSDLSF